MDEILRGHGDWQQRIASALSQATRPISTDPRFTPRLTPRPQGLDRPRIPLARVEARRAATLLLVHPGPAGELVIPLTLRHAELRAHAGEWSLPGGASDPSDVDLQATALREAHEEIGLEPADVQVAGTLDDIWIPVSNFKLRPFVATAAVRPDLQPQTDEVAAILELPLRFILTDDVVSEELITGSDWALKAAVYRYAGERIWGATARTLAMLSAALAEAGNGL